LTIDSRIATMAQKEIAKKTWEMSNDISETEEIYKFDRQSQQSMQTAKPGKKILIFSKISKFRLWPY